MYGPTCPTLPVRRVANCIGIPWYIVIRPSHFFETSKVSFRTLYWEFLSAYLPKQLCLTHFYKEKN